MYSLIQHIKQGGLFKFLSQHYQTDASSTKLNTIKYDTILTDFPVSTADQSLLPKAQRATFEDFAYDISPQGKIEEFLQISQHTLVLISTLPAADFFTCFERTDAAITLLNIGTGIGGITHKLTPDLDDVSLFLDADCPIWEPFDLASFYNIIKNPTKQYIRIPHHEMPASLFNSTILGDNSIKDSKKSIAGMIDGSIYNEKSADCSILTCGGLLAATIAAVHALEQQKISTDFFIWTDYASGFSESFVHHCRKTKNLSIIIDQTISKKSTSTLKEYIDELLDSHNLGNINISYISPDIDALTTVIPEYIYDQVGLGVEAIVDTIRDCQVQST